MRKWLIGLAGFLLGALTMWSWDRLQPNTEPTATIPSASISMSSTPSAPPTPPGAPARPPAPETPRRAAAPPRTAPSQATEAKAQQNRVFNQYEAAIKERNVDKAKEILEAAVQSHPENADYQGELGLLYSRSFGDPSRAIPHLEASAKIDPRNEEVMSELVEITTRNTQSATRDSGEQALRRLANQTNNPNALTAMAEVKLRQGSQKEAVEYVEQSIAEDKNSIKVNSTAADVYLQTGQPEKALDPARTAADKAQETANTKGGEYNQRVADEKKADLATVLNALGRNQEAAEIFAQLAQKNPNNQVYQNGLKDAQNRLAGRAPSTGLPTGNAYRR